MGFLQRMGFAPLAKSIQIDSMDNDLRNGLKNTFIIYAFRPVAASYTDWQEHFNNRFWQDYFKLSIDTYQFLDLKNRINYIFEKGKWYEVYAFLEFTAEVLSELPLSNDFSLNCNKILEREFSGYRFIGNIIAPITTENEFKEIDSAISSSHKSTLMKGVNIHLEDALRKLSDRKSPDYRNSIKESISAVESIAKVISNNPNDTLGGALDKIRGKIKIHAALERGFKQLYGYTSDTDGIRHALMEDSNCDFEDAKYMLVSSSAFINYLIVKAEKAGIKL